MIFTHERCGTGCADMGNCVIVLDDMDAANGCLHYVLGSHRDPREVEAGSRGRRGAGALRRHEVSLSPSLDRTLNTVCCMGS